MQPKPDYVRLIKKELKIKTDENKSTSSYRLPPDHTGGICRH